MINNLIIFGEVMEKITGSTAIAPEQFENKVSESTACTGSSVTAVEGGSHLQSNNNVDNPQQMTDTNLEKREVNIAKPALGDVVSIHELPGEIKKLLLGTHIACPDNYSMIHHFFLKEDRCVMVGGGGQIMDFKVSAQYELRQTDDSHVFGVRFFNIKNKHDLPAFNRETEYPEMNTIFTIVVEDVCFEENYYEDEKKFSSRLEFETDPIGFLRNAQNQIWQREDRTLTDGEPTETNLFYMLNKKSEIHEAQKTFYTYPESS